jgi:hypothetical protein
VLFVIDGAELPVIGEAAQPAAVHCGHPAGEFFFPSTLSSIGSGRGFCVCVWGGLVRRVQRLHV